MPSEICLNESVACIIFQSWSIYTPLPSTHCTVEYGRLRTRSLDDEDGI
jgi:hypothetical protein